MVVLRLQRPAALYVPDSSESIGTLTSDMISPPLSPDSAFDFSEISAAVSKALEYLSNKLQSRKIHITFVVARAKPLPIGQGCNLTIVPIAPMDQHTWRSFDECVRKAAKKFDLRPNWMSVLSRSRQQSPRTEYIVQRSIVQSDVLFSQEGLTLLNIDHIYSLKHRLNALSKGFTPIPEHIYMNSCVHLLRQAIRETKGRPFTKAFFHRAYDHLNVQDDLLVELAHAYKEKYGEEGIVLPKAKRPERPKHTYTPISKNRSVLKRFSLSRKGPRTPHSASDVTPITRNEWNLLMARR